MVIEKKIERIKLSVVILTFNEEIHIGRAFENVCSWANEVVILDSGSSDNTLQIAKEYDVQVHHRVFDNYGAQRNHAIESIKLKNEWMMFLDADEYISDELKLEIGTYLRIDSIDGLVLPRKFIFMGKWIRYGGYFPTYLLRVFKQSRAICTREINEHIIVSGDVAKLKNTFTDHNLKGFRSWLTKHISYAEFEAKALIDLQIPKNLKLGKSQSENKLWLRFKIWNKLPPLIRPFIYYFYRYFIRLGFLDGRIGFIYHFMQGLVFYLMIDIIYLEKTIFKYAKK